jgi:hypothetical protein
MVREVSKGVTQPCAQHVRVEAVGSRASPPAAALPASMVLGLRHV